MKYVRIVGYTAAALVWGAAAANAGRLLPDTGTILRNLAPISTAEAADVAWPEQRLSPTISILTDPATGCEYFMYRVDSGALAGMNNARVTLPERSVTPRIANRAGDVAGCRE